MRRLATTLGALAFLWACAATVLLLVASSDTGIATRSVVAPSGGYPSEMPPSLGTAHGVWMAGLLMFVTMLAGLPLGIALAQPSGRRAAAWTVASLLLGFCALTGGFVGWLYLPSTLLLIACGAVGEAQPPHVPAADRPA